MKEFELSVGDVMQVGDNTLTILEIHNGQVDIRIDDDVYTLSLGSADDSILGFGNSWN